MIFQMMYYGGIVASTLLFLVLLLLFWKQNIYRIICDLTGVTAKTSIHKMHKEEATELAKVKKREVRVRSGNTTQKLAEEGTTLLEVKTEEEAPVSGDETTLLPQANCFEMITDIMEIHSQEVIL